MKPADRQTELTTPPALVLVADAGPHGSNAIRIAEVVEYYDEGDSKMLRVRVWNAGERKFHARRIHAAVVVGAPEPGDVRVAQMEAFREKERAEKAQRERESAARRKAERGGQ